MSSGGKLLVLRGQERPQAPRLLTPALLICAGFMAGFFSEQAKHWSQRLELDDAKARVAACDTEVLKLQHEFNEARDAFWRDRHP